MIKITWIFVLAILMNIRLSKTEVQKVAHGRSGESGYLANLLHHVIRQEGSIKDLENKLEKQEEKHVKDISELNSRNEEITELESKHTEDIHKLETKLQNQQEHINELERKHAADMKQVETQHDKDMIELKNNLETTHDEDIDKIEKKHDEDLKKLEAFWCPSQLPVRWGGHCYGLFRMTLSYVKAQNHCQTFGGSLVWIEDSAEQNFIQLKFLPKKVRTWIGCNDMAHHGRFVWSHNKQPATYTNWAPGEPNNGLGETLEDCCMMGLPAKVHGLGQWNDSPCTEPSIQQFICKN